jgi:hypothetical protein
VGERALWEAVRAYNGPEISGLEANGKPRVVSSFWKDVFLRPPTEFVLAKLAKDMVKNEPQLKGVDEKALAASLGDIFSGAEKSAYSQLSPGQQKQFQALHERIFDIKVSEQNASEDLEKGLTRLTNQSMFYDALRQKDSVKAGIATPEESKAMDDCTGFSLMPAAAATAR